ncbi:hypothetical protein HAX54_007333 [Datura stramonium]|uniref:Uncharacterized protein n=1 Tax=Datura stramonium TaxID=4076 RepID=A0ABS8WYN2_DATST|nr:hypothetical protein [Datura stramonium]
MAPNCSKGMEMVVAGKGLKRLWKGSKGASSSKAKEVEPHGLTWFNTKMEAKYAPEHWIDEGLLTQEFPAIRDKSRELGVGYIFAELEESKLTLVREFCHASPREA